MKTVFALKLVIIVAITCIFTACADYLSDNNNETVNGKIGLPGIWVLVAVTIGGSVGGILGMLLGVPILSVVYSLVKVSVNKKVERKNKKKEA